MRKQSRGVVKSLIERDIYNETKVSLIKTLRSKKSKWIKLAIKHFKNVKCVLKKVIFSNSQ